MINGIQIGMQSFKSWWEVKIPKKQSDLEAKILEIQGNCKYFPPQKICNKWDKSSERRKIYSELGQRDTLKKELAEESETLLPVVDKSKK